MDHSQVMQEIEPVIPLMILLVLSIFHCEISLVLSVFTVKLTMKVVQDNFHKLVISDSSKTVTT